MARQPRDPSTPELASLRGAVPNIMLKAASRIGTPVDFAAGERLFGIGDPVAGVHLILSGAVRIIREGEGRAVVVHRERAGGLLGEVALFSGGTYPASAIAVERTRACCSHPMRTCARSEPLPVSEDLT